MKTLMATLLLLSATMITQTTSAQNAKLNEPAPLFKVKNHAGVEFDLASRKGLWTVLYFYPKAGTPGCTKQACAFRDSIKKIRDLGVEVYGISTDTIDDQAKFHKEHRLSFDLLADPDAKVTELYGAKMPIVKVAKRWTFIIDPQLNIKNLLKDVDPAMDPERVVAEIIKLKR